MTASLKFDVTCKSPSQLLVGFFMGDNDLDKLIHDDLSEIKAAILEASRCGLPDAVAALILMDDGKEAQTLELCAARTGVGVLVIRFETPSDLNTADPGTLATFLTRALRTYPESTRIAFGVRGHGTILHESIDRGSSPGRYGVNFIGDDWKADDVLTTREGNDAIHSALESAGYAASSPPRLDILILDSCRNGSIECFEEMAGCAQIVIGAAHTMIPQGLDYGRWLRRTFESRPHSAEQWAAQALNAFREFLWTDTPPESRCLSAYRPTRSITDRFSQVVSALNDLDEPGFRWVISAREMTYQYIDASRRTTHSTAASGVALFDLKGFVENLSTVAASHSAKTRAPRRSSIRRLTRACHGVAEAIDTALVPPFVRWDGGNTKTACGLAIYIPASRIGFGGIAKDYCRLRFNIDTEWCGYLDTHLKKSPVARRPPRRPHIDPGRHA